jgi:hypothetical protein
MSAISASEIEAEGKQRVQAREFSTHVMKKTRQEGGNC